MAENKKSFSEMVEELEDHEDIVECKECFDLFPKADCMKVDHGYVCPVCGRGEVAEFVPTSKDITIDLFDQDFPEYEGKPNREGCGAECVKDVFDALIEDEVEAIEGYEKAEVELVRADLPNKDEVEETLEHIKEEEEEHIEELKALSVPEQPAPLKEDSSKSVYVAYDLGNHGEVIAACYADSAEEALKKLELPFIERTGKRGSEVKDLYIELAEEDVLSDLTPDLFVETLTEHVNEEHPAIESEQELSGTDNAVIDCKVAKVVAHSEDEKPVDCKGVEKPLERPLTENRVTAYNAAQAKANDLNQSIVYGYSSSKDGSFRELELAILEPGFEEDMENIYDDFGVLYVAYPGKSLQESLEEACTRLIEKHQLSEGPLDAIRSKITSGRADKVADKLFNKGGFIIWVGDDKGPVEEIMTNEKYKLTTPLSNMGDARKKAKQISTIYPDKVVLIRPIVTAEFPKELRSQIKIVKDSWGLFDGRELGPGFVAFIKGKEDKVGTSGKKAMINLGKVYSAYQKVSEQGDDSAAIDAARDASEAEEKPEEAADTLGTETPVEDTPPAEAPVEATPSAETPAEAPAEAPAEKPAETEEKPDEEPAGTKRDMSKQSRARDNNLKILKALKNAGYDITDLRDGKKASEKLKQLRREIFGESLDNDYDEYDEDEVECTWCEERFPKSECRFEVGDGGPDGGLGWLCHRCEAAIKSRGEDLTFRENSYWDFLDEE